MTDLISIIKRFKNTTVLCIGDVMLDKFVYGQVERISPEAPVPILRYHHQTEMLGGAGNVVRNIASLGGQTIFVSVVGDDAIDQTIQHHLKSLIGCQSYLVQDPNRATTLKTRYIAEHQQVLRIDHETVHRLPSEIEAQVEQHFKDNVAQCDIVVLSDYGKGLFHTALNQRLIQCAKQYNKIVIVDPKSPNFCDYRGATILTPNLKEFECAIRTKITHDDDLKSQAHQLCKTADLDYLLVTRGADGMSLFSQDHRDYHLTTQAQEVFDVSGAGDTVIASLALAYASQSSIQDAMKIANYSASIAVSKLGTSSVTQQELIDTMISRERTLSINDNPLQSPFDQIEQWKKQGLTIGFTNGCFDILHCGHTSLLNEASQQCDRLVVGLNSDRSVKELKGDSRPINGEQDRGELLMQLRSVDLVIIFDELTPLTLIKKISPDVLIKGQDYTLDQIVGATEVIAAGGQVYRANLVKDKSTSNIIKAVCTDQMPQDRNYMTSKLYE